MCRVLRAYAAHSAGRRARQCCNRRRAVAQKIPIAGYRRKTRRCRTDWRRNKRGYSEYFETADQIGRQFFQVCPEFRKSCRQVQDSFRQRSGGRAGNGSGFQSVGIKIGHIRVKTFASRASEQQGFGRIPFGKNQHAASLNSVQSFVSRKAQRVDPRSLHIDGNVSACLCAVADHDDAFGKQCAHGIWVNACSRDVGSQCKYCSDRVFTDGCGYVFRGNFSAPERYERDFGDPFPFQIKERP